MATEHEPGEVGGLSRRQLLTRGAVAGGLIWAAPVIRTTAAYATTANGTERPCTNFFMVVINPAGHARPGPGSLNAKSIPPAIRQWFIDNPDVDVQFPPVPPLLTQTGNEVWAVLLPEVTGPNAAGRQCRMVSGWGAKGQSFKEGYVDPNPPLAVEVGRRLLFPCPDHPTKGGDDGGCKNGHDDGDHDADDVACDASATASAQGTTGVGTADATPSATPNSGQIGSDGVSSSDSISSDGGPSRTVSSDGSPSSGDSSNPRDCIDQLFLIFCCPR